MLRQDVIINDTEPPVRHLHILIEEEMGLLNDEVGQLGLTTCKQLYDDAFLVEWILMSCYSPGDFGHRFIWPKFEPEAA